MFIATLFTTAKLWKWPECPKMDEWIKYYLAIKKNEITLFAGK
jgi:hypothetical protein